MTRHRPRWGGGVADDPLLLWTTRHRPSDGWGVACHPHFEDGTMGARKWMAAGHGSTRGTDGRAEMDGRRARIDARHGWARGTDGRCARTAAGHGCPAERPQGRRRRRPRMNWMVGRA